MLSPKASQLIRRAFNKLFVIRERDASVSEYELHNGFSSELSA